VISFGRHLRFPRKSKPFGKNLPNSDVVGYFDRSGYFGFFTSIGGF